MTSQEKWLDSSQIAELLGVNRDTVRRWLRSGALKGVYVGGRSGYRVRQSDLDEFLRARETSGGERRGTG
jgi:excisionase family DNA binding protein